MRWKNSCQLIGFLTAVAQAACLTPLFVMEKNARWVRAYSRYQNRVGVPILTLVEDAIS